MSATVVKYSWQPDAETGKWLNYLWFFYVIIEYNNKAKVACTKLADWNIFANFVRIFFLILLWTSYLWVAAIIAEFHWYFFAFIDEVRIIILYQSDINLWNEEEVITVFAKLLLTSWIIYWKVFYWASCKTKSAIDFTNNSQFMKSTNYKINYIVTSWNRFSFHSFRPRNFQINIAISLFCPRNGLRNGFHSYNHSHVESWLVGCGEGDWQISSAIVLRNHCNRRLVAKL